MLFLKNSVQCRFALVCKIFYRWYKKHYKNQTVVILYESQDKWSFNSNSIKVLQHYVNLNNWVHLKFISISKLADFQKNGGYPIKGLYLNEIDNLPDKLDYAGLSALVLFPYLEKPEFSLDIGFFERFTCLSLLMLQNFFFNHYTAPIFSKLTSLKCIYLIRCSMIQCDLSNMFANCATLQQLYLVSSSFGLNANLCIPQQLKKLIISRCICSFIFVKAVECTQLECV